MKLQTSFQRKIAYLVAIAVLLYFLYLLGAPATGGGDQGQGRPGGKLAQMRAEVGLNQARLGQIDPTGETLKLATFGLRGVAANLLWEKANRYKMKKDWTNLSATVNQIIKLQPNFISVWLFQAWNQSYNISVEFDDVRQRYRWVIRGIRFLEKGTKHNELEPRLPWEMGWIISNKIGRADEHRQFRKMFVEDDEFHTLPDGSIRDRIDRDNWLVASEWFSKAELAADKYGVKMKGKGPLIYRSNAPMCLMSYAEALEKDGTFGERARVAWQKALDAWNEYGEKGIPTSSGVIIHLCDQEEHDGKADKLAEEIDQIQGDDGKGSELRERIRQENIADLTDNLREALEIPWKDRKGKQLILGDRADAIVKVTEEAVARGITGANRRKALEKAARAAVHREISRRISLQRYIVNFDYWRLRAEMEAFQFPDDDGKPQSIVVDARKLIHEADEAYEGPADMTTAIEKYDEAFGKWRKVLDLKKFRPMLVDSIFGDDMIEVIERYEHILNLDDKIEEKGFPEKFILKDVLDLHGKAK